MFMFDFGFYFRFEKFFAHVSNELKVYVNVESVQCIHCSGCGYFYFHFSYEGEMLIAFINHMQSLSFFSFHFVSYLISHAMVYCNSIDQINTKKKSIRSGNCIYANTPSTAYLSVILSVSSSSFHLKCLNIACTMDARLLFDANNKMLSHQKQGIFLFIVHCSVKQERFHTC